METNNFHSTVLQRPRDNDHDHRSGPAAPGHRDIFNPAPGSSSSSSSRMSPVAMPGSQGHQPRHSFSLRSPTQPDYHPPPFSSPSSSNNQGPRPTLHNPFMAAPSGAPTLPPHSHGQQAPPLSPLHAPPMFYSQPDLHPPAREKTSTSSFYDPTTDTTRERKVSDTSSSWANATGVSTPKQPARDPYPYTQPPSSVEPPSAYYNGTTYVSPSKYQPASPLAHTHQQPPPVSPTARPPQPLTSPSRRISDLSMPGGPAAVAAAPPSVTFPPVVKPDTASQPLQAPPVATTPSQAADVMSFSNILSSAEPPPPKPKPITIPEKKEKAPRKPRGQRDPDATPRSNGRKSAVVKEKDIPQQTPRIPPKRQANGLSKFRPMSPNKEKTVRNKMAQLDAEADDTPDSDAENEYAQYQNLSSKRQRLLDDNDGSQRMHRRTDVSEHISKRLKDHTESGKRRYEEVFYDEAMAEVRERELFAEKERKKDMQRKRRREKSMAATIEQKEAALAKARAAEDESERQKHLREAERANKKAQQTKLVLQKGIKGPARNLAPLELNLEGGSMTTFQVDSEGAKKGKGGRGTRPKKSKEQKQAEKDSAEAAQAALDAGLELPAKEETAKIRIKTKGAGKDKGKEADKTEVKETKEKEKVPEEPPPPPEKFASKGYHQIHDQIWRDMARKDVTKVYKIAIDSHSTKASNLKKTVILAAKEAKRWQLRTNKGQKDMQARAKRVMRDMMGFWKRNEREERDLRKAAERQELENARQEEANREAARQKRKLNFLISQTELYSHFIGKKIKTQEVERSTDHPEVAKDDPVAAAATAHQLDLDVAEPSGPVGTKVTNFENLDFDAEDESALRAAAMANAQNAIAEAQQKARDFNKASDPDLDEDGEMNFQNPTGLGDVEIEQPKLLNCQLKEYQIKGLNWLANLYEQGINGILADEMGLGKTVQSISVMAYLAEKYDIWGPFLVVSPASTLHNWQQEIAKFVPGFKVLPYWGTVADRKVLRKFWDRKHSTYKRDAPFHVMVTSYQMVVSDVAYFQKMRWQYMILDEAQAIKSSESSRWKCLLGFHCRNRLLLTGTPIQNNMQELWALLHFIMPSLFDSHDEFSEWFSKDIESHAQSNTKLNEDQLKRLHMILKPFMLRRVKKHVQKELGDKIEKDVFCQLTYRQRAIYTNLRNQISLMDLIEKATIGDDNDSSTLMNLVMQFRKVCNHPDLFERADTVSPYSFGYYADLVSFVREGNNVSVGYSTRNLIEYELPTLIWTGDGRLRKPTFKNKAGHRTKILEHLMNVWSPENIRESMNDDGAFSFLRFADTSPAEASHAAQQDVFMRSVSCTQRRHKASRLAKMDICYQGDFTPAHALFMVKAQKDLLPVAEVTAEGVLDKLMNISREAWRDQGYSRMEAAAHPAATAPPIEVFCNSPEAVTERQQIMFNIPMRRALFGPNSVEEMALVTQNVPVALYPVEKMLPPPDNEKNRYTNISVPSMRRFVTDSGKLAKLDQLLFELKEGGHRVLLYFQMTRMIDLMEEYLTYRNWKYCRLDGSTKLEDRRDTVHDFQTRPDIFIFLLSTRAGGLGINLTSADTVIFYDSDWNPTIDSQAMDRAHRLGQTKQVTVYRLITRGTIEERIRKRALQKEEVQRVVIQGGGAASSGVDFSGRRAPENRNRDIALWLADDEQAEMIEKREKELLASGEYDKQKKKGGKRKRAQADVSLDDMYHEGEGRFDDDKPSGTATPATVEPPAPAAEAGGPKKRRKGTSKKAKSVRQRLAIADGDVNA